MMASFIKSKSGLFAVVFISMMFHACQSGNDNNELPEPEPQTYALPTLFIETQNALAITSKEDYINCNLIINGNQRYKNFSGAARIRGRGNSTWLWYDKKPYRIKLDEKAEILGLDANKDWILLANYRDPTHLMNAISFRMAEQMHFTFTNHTRFVEVTLNGNYIGLYQLTEQIEVAKSRVDIDESEGYLLSLDLDDGPGLSPNASDNFWSQVFKMPVCVKSPKDRTTQQLNTIKVDFAQLETAINSYNYESVERLLDIPSFIDYLILQEITYNVELAAPRSVYMYKDKGGKYFMGPVWDFDAGFDFDWNTMYTGHNYFTSYKELVLGTNPASQIGGYNVPLFFTRMFKNNTFVARYKARWNELMTRIPDDIITYIDNIKEENADAMERDFRRWPIDNYYVTEIEKLKTWLTNRFDYVTTVTNNIPDPASK